MRNGDFLPTRLQAQQDAVNIVCHSKTRANPENNVGLISMANNCEVLTTLTPDTGRILSKLHAIQPKGKICFCTGIRVAHLALKHRQGKNHKMRIIAFVGSPVEDSDKDLVKMAKRLKKEKVNVDIINFGEEKMQAMESRHQEELEMLREEKGSLQALVAKQSGVIRCFWGHWGIQPSAGIGGCFNERRMKWNIDVLAPWLVPSSSTVAMRANRGSLRGLTGLLGSM
ncbi:unnamed protein product [Coregonus sp. 'balchen']|nr:unnamed protein product [Coregonus sp. 'balchen']